MGEKEKVYRTTGNLHLKRRKLKNSLIAVGIFFVIFFSSTLFAKQLILLSLKDDEIQVQSNYIHFQNRMEYLIETGENIVIGYKAFYKASEEINQNEMETFLSYITEDYKEIIRNVGIIEDTTIIYNYPYIDNQSTIGVDLETIKEQREDVLRVKNSQIKIFQGPVQLVQGGTGYIIRVPVLNNDQSYWGQLSIVLRADVINEKILEYAKNSNLEICIFKDDSLTEPIIGNIEVMDQQPFRYEVTDSSWIVYAVTRDTEHTINLSVVGLLFSILAGLIAMFAFYSSYRSKYRLQYSLAHDPLTDLYNRYYLEIIQEELIKTKDKTSWKYGLLHIDLDNFKQINDQYGHVRGDEVLIEVSRILKKISRKNELVFRIGGDEFLIFIPHISALEELKGMRARYLMDFEHELAGYRDQDMVGLSVGVALMDETMQDFDSVLKTADFDMYENKRRNKQHYR